MIGKMHQFNQSHHQILDLSWSTHDLKLYDNQSNSVVASVFTVIAGFTLVLGAIVHRGIFKLLKRLPQRPINTIIYPTLVIFDRAHGFAVLARHYSGAAEASKNWVCRISLPLSNILVAIFLPKSWRPTF